MTPAQCRLAARIGHAFDEPGLFIRALTHASAGPRNNERLEFLGDAILTFLVAEFLYDSHPGASEGKLTRLRSRVVRRESLAGAARKLGIGDALVLGLPVNERREAASAIPSSPAPSRPLWEPSISIRISRRAGTVREHCWKSGSTRHRGAAVARTRSRACKSACRRRQSRCRPIESWAVEGAAHCRTFTASCRVEGIDEDTFGTGPSRQRAELDAAARAMAFLDEGDH